MIDGFDEGMETHLIFDREISNSKRLSNVSHTPRYAQIDIIVSYTFPKNNLLCFGSPGVTPFPDFAFLVAGAGAGV